MRVNRIYKRPISQPRRIDFSADSLTTWAINLPSSPEGFYATCSSSVSLAWQFLFASAFPFQFFLVCKRDAPSWGLMLARVRRFQEWVIFSWFLTLDKLQGTRLESYSPLSPLQSPLLSGKVAMIVRTIFYFLPSNHNWVYHLFIYLAFTCGFQVTFHEFLLFLVAFVIFRLVGMVTNRTILPTDSYKFCLGAQISASVYPLVDTTCLFTLGRLLLPSPF